jgi:hypothetical protein
MLTTFYFVYYMTKRASSEPFPKIAGPWSTEKEARENRDRLFMKHSSGTGGWVVLSAYVCSIVVNTKDMVLCGDILERSSSI